MVRQRKTRSNLTPRAQVASASGTAESCSKLGDVTPQNGVRPQFKPARPYDALTLMTWIAGCPARRGLKILPQPLSQGIEAAAVVERACVSPLAAGTKEGAAPKT